MPDSIRQLKVASQIQRLVAMILLRDVADPRIDGLVSVTRVQTTPDLREARVFISVLGGARTPATVLVGIASAARRIQTEVAKNLALRYAPRLSFHLDESLKKQAEILRQIDEAVRDQPPENQPPVNEGKNPP
jgi:ribosome-binding factor A